MGAAPAARPEITTLISVFSIPAACFHLWLAREPRSRSGNMLELTFGVRACAVGTDAAPGACRSDSGR